ncbi:MAG: glycerate kinase [Deltaproteobacteria bacterium]|nr:glycerate kinase [Deltaproteobacteria bacterium]
MENASPRETAIDLFNAALKSVDPYRLVQQYSEAISAAYIKEHCRKLYLVSFGKAAFAMTRALVESPAGKLITRGIVITKYGHAPGTLAGNLRIYEAGHPVPDERGLTAARQVIDLLKDVDRETLVVCLISGGGSALLVAPQDGITLDEKQKITDVLLKAGANINELNTVRKHISAVKGGRLAQMAYPSRVISLILSDVIGDPLDVIASGPTSPDKTTFCDALDVIEKYHLKNKIPDHAMNLLRRGAEGSVGETPQYGNAVFEKVENIIVGSNRIATAAAAKRAEEHGYATTVLTSELQGEAREAAKWLAQEALDIRRRKEARRKICLISGGETTVKVSGTGLGGRNTELALAFAEAIAGRDGITLLSAGTDGTDGPTDAAGAVVDGQTVQKAQAQGLWADVFLNNNDSYSFFKNTGELLVTGSTGTNVMDIQIILLD